MSSSLGILSVKLYTSRGISGHPALMQKYMHCLYKHVLELEARGRRDFKKSRECHGFVNPCGLASRVVAGAGAGWVFVTPA
jgi:hypothetical protein